MCTILVFLPDWLEGRSSPFGNEVSSAYQEILNEDMQKAKIKVVTFLLFIWPRSLCLHWIYIDMNVCSALGFNLKQTFRLSVTELFLLYTLTWSEWLTYRDSFQLELSFPTQMFLNLFPFFHLEWLGYCLSWGQLHAPAWTSAVAISDLMKGKVAGVLGTNCGSVQTHCTQSSDTEGAWLAPRGLQEKCNSSLFYTYLFRVKFYIFHYESLRDSFGILQEIYLFAYSCKIYIAW